MNRLGIESQTVFGLPPVEHVSMAADLGCCYISTGLNAIPWKLDRFPEWSLRDNPGMRREMMAAMRDRGVSISLAEGFAIRPRSDARDRAGDLDLLAELGAKRASAVCMEPDLTRSLDQLSILSELTADRNMGLLLEFAPPHSINSLEKAMRAIRDIGRSNVTLVIDTMHFFRTGGTVADLASVDPQLIGYVQLSDAPLIAEDEDYYREACCARRCPGDGELPLGELLEVVPRDVPIGLEVPNRADAESTKGLEPAVKRMVEAARRLMDLNPIERELTVHRKNPQHVQCASNSNVE